MFQTENAIAADPNVRFYLLIVLSGAVTVVLAAAWASSVGPNDTVHASVSDFWGAIFMTFQVLVTGGSDITILENDTRIIFFLMIAAGVIVVSILIGLITDSVKEYMDALARGTTKVVEKNHTLILGWNEATTRVVCQIAFLRRTFLSQNNTWSRWLMPWTRVLPSSPIVTAPIILMNDSKEKEVMQQIVADAFAGRAIDPRQTRIGEDVVFRKGDPTNNHDRTFIIVVGAGVHQTFLLYISYLHRVASSMLQQGSRLLTLAATPSTPPRSVFQWCAWRPTRLVRSSS